jgi:hypothetical protein
MIPMAGILWRGVATSFGSAGIFAALLFVGVAFAPRWKRRTGAIFLGLVSMPYLSYIAVGWVLNPPYLTLLGACGVAIATIALIYGAGSMAQMLLHRTKP